jgi:hypothetical protein
MCLCALASPREVERELVDAEEAAIKHHAQLFVTAAQALLVRAVQDLADSALPVRALCVSLVCDDAWRLKLPTTWKLVATYLQQVPGAAGERPSGAAPALQAIIVRLGEISTIVQNAFGSGLDANIALAAITAAAARGHQRSARHGGLLFSPYDPSALITPFHFLIQCGRPCCGERQNTVVSSQ